ncbi:MAG: 3-mercaptopyruvate sulfurtransferase [Rhodospirillales bacterium]|nr:3-mercaptopyruvate sulfurtransferase [Rhodospirillales bacterium]MDH3791922.1 3-mercaptopyruvate sulfurtransferase [Rhodospirillales bacterium]MDH3910902.1 3-mercaptopyruvate sulfurtransferase [Rhodospirillales bacterium]MDH3917158.1 3-mercaptopyruvate sulfurtransferase [Rhodospirillales bacterium]MDH3967969.1 3-mercaptopyruvate sulfurtransferase [Rhodospirillales bacterium]
MADFDSDAVVSTTWLAEHLSAPDVHVVDASYYLPDEGLSGRQEFELQHIPGAVFFDIDEIADGDDALPHMLPSPEKFSSKVTKLGLGDGVRMVIYDQRGLMSAPRVWWTFRYFGHDDVAVLDGGLPKWLAEGRPVEDGPARAVERHFTARMNSFMLRDKEQIRANLASRREQVLDARSQGRFEASEPELWPGRRAGHIPGSLSLPYTDLVDAEAQTLRPVADLRACFEAAGLDMARPVITTCGSGVTAAVLALGLHLAGHKDVALYDGSWAEWGLPGDTPVDTGPAT